MPPYHEIFKTGETVGIRDRDFLQEFMDEWKYHHPLSTEQMEFAGIQVTIRSTMFYHGGGVLYTLGRFRASGGVEDIPGIWHECLLDDNRFGWKKVNAADVYEVVPEERGGEPYVVVYDIQTRGELLITRQIQNREYAEAMSQVASVRDATMFAHRYGFSIYGLRHIRWRSAMTKDEYMKLMNFPKEWSEFNLFPEELFQEHLDYYNPGSENASAHVRAGVFSWWLRQEPTKEQLSKLVTLAFFDPDQFIANHIRSSIKYAKNFDAEIEAQMNNAV